MRNNIKRFDPIGYNDGTRWDINDLGVNILMTTIVAAVVFGVLAGIFSSVALLWLVLLGPITGTIWFFMVKNHVNYGLGLTQIQTIRMIESLPPTVAAIFGSDYRERISKNGNVASLHEEVTKLSGIAKANEAVRMRKETAIDDMVEDAKKEANRLEAEQKELR